MRYHKINECLQCDTPLVNGKCPTCYRGRMQRARNVTEEPKFVCCAEISRGMSCGTTAGLIRINALQKNMPPRFLCLKHYEEKKPKSELELMMESRMNYKKYVENTGASQ